MISALLASGAASDSLSLTTAPEYLSTTPTPAGSTWLVKSGHVSERLVDSSSAQSVHREAEPDRFHGANRGTSSLARSETCPSARKGLRWYRARALFWARKMGEPTGSPLGARVERRWSSTLRTSCPRYLANIARAKAHAARRAYEASRTLRDFPIRPGSNAWLRAVEEVQRPYPGSRSWLLSCSAAEGGWGRWVIHGGDPYYPGVENVGTSSGHLQYRYSTFKGHYRRALDDLRARDFKLPVHLRVVSVTAWRSALGQALAGGWGILHGQRSHWSASFGRGC